MRAHSIIDGLLHESRDRGFSVRIRVFTATRQPDPIDGVELHQLAIAVPENTFSFPRRLFGEILVGAAASLAILRRTKLDDVLVTSSPPFLPSLVLGLAASLRRRRYILDIRDLYPLVYADAGLISKDSWIFRKLEQLEHRWLAKSSFILAATEGLARHVSASGTPAQVLTVYNGFPARLSEISKAKRERFTVCFHGILGQFQDVESVIEVAWALEKCNIDMVVVGYGPKAALLKEKIPANLQYVGRKSFEDTMDIVSSCHVGLCLRRDGAISRDAFPVKVWEYLGLALPSVVTPPCEAGDFLELNGCGSQFLSGSIGEVVDWIVSMRDDPERYGRYVEKCQTESADYTREKLGRIAARHMLDIVRPLNATSASINIPEIRP